MSVSPALRMVFEYWREYSLDAIFPPRCAGCRCYDKAVFCADCAAQAKPIVPPFCFVCGSPFDPLAQAAAVCAQCRDNRYHGAPPFTALRSVFEFEDPIRHAVHDFKYKGKTALAGPLSTLLSSYLYVQPAAAPQIPWQTLNCILPVPLFGWRRYCRGYNQSTLLAHELGKSLNLPVIELLCRTRYTTPQVRLSARQRAANVRGAFAVNKRIHCSVALDAGPVLLLDDVCTTGATIHECAAILKNAGAREVYALTLAKQI